MRIKRTICRMLAVCIASATVSIALEAADDVCFHLRSGQKIVFSHGDHPVMVFGDDNSATIKSDNKEVSSHRYTELHKITFGASSGIGDVIVDSEGRMVNIGPHDFALMGFETGTTVSVVAVSGSLAKTDIVADSVAHKLSLSDLSPGVYIVAVGRQSFKIAIK